MRGAPLAFLLQFFATKDAHQRISSSVDCQSIIDETNVLSTQVYDEEWSYADMIAPVAMQTGIFCCAPRQCDLAVTFKDSIPMGTTSYAKSAILGLIAKLEVEWLSRDYDYLKRNCNHFCNFFCQQIGVGAVPSWTLNLATVGSSLKEQECSLHPHCKL